MDTFNNLYLVNVIFQISTVGFFATVLNLYIVGWKMDLIGRMFKTIIHLMSSNPEKEVKISK